MKVAALVLALVALGSTAPQPKALFHEHFEDFLNLIQEEVGDELADLGDQYMEYEEFRTSLDYLRTPSFKNLAYEMESLPEFVAVVEFLEQDNIDILFFIDLINNGLESLDEFMKKKSGARAVPSGTTFNSYIQDITALFPKDKLAALYEQKLQEDEVFKSAIDNLYSDEWNQIFTALFESDTFKAEIQVLSDNGVELVSLLDEILAVFGQL